MASIIIHSSNHVISDYIIVIQPSMLLHYFSPLLELKTSSSKGKLTQIIVHKLSVQNKDCGWIVSICFEEGSCLHWKHLRSSWSLDSILYNHLPLPHHSTLLLGTLGKLLWYWFHKSLCFWVSLCDSAMINPILMHDLYSLISSLVKGGPLLLLTMYGVPWVEKILSNFGMIHAQYFFYILF